MSPKSKKPLRQLFWERKPKGKHLAPSGKTLPALPSPMLLDKDGPYTAKDMDSTGMITVAHVDEGGRAAAKQAKALERAEFAGRMAGRESLVDTVMKRIHRKGVPKDKARIVAIGIFGDADHMVTTWIDQCVEKYWRET